MRRARLVRTSACDGQVTRETLRYENHGCTVRCTSEMQRKSTCENKIGLEQSTSVCSHTEEPTNTHLNLTCCTGTLGHTPPGSAPASAHGSRTRSHDTRYQRPSPRTACTQTSCTDLARGHIEEGVKDKQEQDQKKTGTFRVQAGASH